MSRASSLAAAADYLSEAVRGLAGAARLLDHAGVLGGADSARDLHGRAESLHTDISLAASVAHRAERPEFYDESGRWVGRTDGTEKS
ncbi:hypothetical protein C8K30_110110 [Promicromonospora sp. AC04]|uniref:hypothetical protein n=1 Tax=Promicromonospora sp. AC04 TaxID=2135723 RepID=UPI000D3A8BEC|nr:hypothetical protein [Promicromonospora sp. AC04]PUB23967.1 hypothetical protein C8K30_110110 [Promicromonospora sp. AC04]